MFFSMNGIIGRVFSLAEITVRNLFLEAGAAGDTGAEVGGFIVSANLTQRAITPIESVCFGAGFCRFRQRLGFVNRDKHFLCAKIFAKGRVHGSPDELPQRSADQRLGDGHLVAVVLPRIGFLQDDFGGASGDIVVQLLAFEKIVRRLDLPGNRRHRAENNTHFA
jgi:hypothetical protein